MEINPQKQLEALIHRELSKLPERQAPDSLIPRVLAQIEARTRKHWWQRSWAHWPLAVQFASVPALLLGIAGVITGLFAAWNWGLARVDLSGVSTRLESFGVIWDVVNALGNAVLIFGRAGGQQWLLLALFIPLAMYLACVGLGTLCYRVAGTRR